jgi:hypothetical protein
MSVETCLNCGEPVVEGRINCGKCGEVYPDAADRKLTWDPTDGEGNNKGAALTGSADAEDATRADDA